MVPAERFVRLLYGLESRKGRRLLRIATVRSLRRSPQAKVASMSARPRVATLRNFHADACGVSVAFVRIDVDEWAFGKLTVKGVEERVEVDMLAFEFGKRLLG